MSERIGFVGLGQMGQPMALNLLQTGYKLRVFDVREERMAPLVVQGAEPGTSPGEVTEPGGIVLSMVPDDRALLVVALGEGGILSRMGRGGVHLSLSTVSPEGSVQLARVYEQQGNHYLAATVLGRPEVAEAARLSILLSGHPDAKVLVLSLLDALGLHLYDLGERVEVANAVKLGYNFLIAAAIEAMGEEAALVEQCGADRAQFLRMLVEIPLFTGAVYEGYGRMIGERDYSDARFPVSMGLKDVELILQAADRVAVPLPYAEIVHAHLLAARVGGRSHEDWSVLADFVTQERAGAAMSGRGVGPKRAEERGHDDQCANRHTAAKPCNRPSWYRSEPEHPGAGSDGHLGQFHRLRPAHPAAPARAACDEWGDRSPLHAALRRDRPLLPAGGLARGSLRVSPRALCSPAPGRDWWMPPAGASQPGLDGVVPVGNRAGCRGSHCRCFAGGTTRGICGLRPRSFWRSDAAGRRTRAIRDPHPAGALRLARGLDVLGCLWSGSQCALPPPAERRATSTPGSRPSSSGGCFRSRSLWTIGLVHLGTLGLGQAIASWLAVYFALSYGLPLDLSAMLGAVGLLAGMLFRPLGGLLLSRRVFTHSALMLAGTALACIGIALLALPLHAPLVTGWGLALFACGTTLPYAAVFDEAGHIGAESALGPGTAQGVVSVLSAPASAFGPPLIGALLGQHGSFVLSFGALVPLGVVALVAAFVAGPLITRSRATADLLRLRERDSDAYLAQVLTSRSRVTRHASPLPAIVTLGAHAQGRGSAIIRRLQHAGALPLVLPASPAPTAGEAADLLVDEAFFQETFDQYIWLLFCQLLRGQTRGLCLIEGSQQVKDTNGTRSTEPLNLVPRAASDAWSAMLQRYLALLAWLVGMPVLGASWELHSLELTSRRNERAGPALERIWPLPAKHAVGSGDAQESAVYAQFVAACASYTPPAPEDLSPFRDDIFGWLRRRDRAFLRQLYQFKVASGQETTGTYAVIAPAEARQPRKEAAAKTVPIQRVKAR